MLWRLLRCGRLLWCHLRDLLLHVQHEDTALVAQQIKAQLSTCSHCLRLGDGSLLGLCSLAPCRGDCRSNSLTTLGCCTGHVCSFVLLGLLCKRLCSCVWLDECMDASFSVVFLVVLVGMG